MILNFNVSFPKFFIQKIVMIKLLHVSVKLRSIAVRDGKVSLRSRLRWNNLPRNLKKKIIVEINITVNKCYKRYSKIDRC